jgi:hypothetical protein
MQLEVQLPDGVITMFVIARFVGKTMSGEGVGVELFLLGPEERRRWTRYYRRVLLARTAPAPAAAVMR